MLALDRLCETAEVLVTHGVVAVTFEHREAAEAILTYSQDTLVR